MKNIVRICGNCMDFENGVCAIRYLIKNGVKSPMKVAFNKLGCQVFEYKILQKAAEQNGHIHQQPQHKIPKRNFVRAANVIRNFSRDFYIRGNRWFTKE